ncbi:MAG: universal stress protein [Panacibacter sp.]
MKNLSIQNLLVPVDFSDNSMNALYTAVEIAKLHGASIKLLFVNDNDDNLYPDQNLITTQDMVKALGNLTKSVKEGDHVECDFAYESGSVTNCIIRESVNMKADMIIIGKNGNSGNRNMFAGSYAYNIMKKSICPVLMVPSGKIWSQFHNILFPVRPILSMLEKYTMIKEMMHKNNATLHLLNLRNPDYLNELHIISKLMELLKEKLEQDKINASISYYFKDDRFADKILDVTKDLKMNIDLLVIMSEPNAATKLFVLAPYEQQIIHQSNVPVLIMKAETVLPSKEAVLKALEKQMTYN